MTTEKCKKINENYFKIKEILKSQKLADADECLRLINENREMLIKLSKEKFEGYDFNSIND